MAHSKSIKVIDRTYTPKSRTHHEGYGVLFEDEETGIRYNVNLYWYQPEQSEDRLMADITKYTKEWTEQH